MVDEDISESRPAYGRLRSELLPHPRPDTRDDARDVPHRYGGTTPIDNRRLRRGVVHANPVVRDGKRRERRRVS